MYIDIKEIFNYAFIVKDFISDRHSPLQIAAFLFVILILGGILFGIMSKVVTPGGSGKSSQEEGDQGGDGLKIKSFKPFVPSTFKMLVEYDGQSGRLELKEFSVLSERIEYDARLASGSSYKIVFNGDKGSVISSLPVSVNEHIFSHPGPGEAAKNTDFPNKIASYIYVPFDAKVKNVSLLKNGQIVFEIPVPSYPVQEGKVRNTSQIAQTCSRIPIAIISDGYSNMAAFRNDANNIILSLSVDPYGAASNYFDFKIYENTTPTGCTSNIVACFNTPALNGVIQSARAETGAAGAIVLVQGGNTSASVIGSGPAVINTIDSGNLIWRGKHEFLGHMIGQLYDRYYNQGAGYVSQTSLNPGLRSNCSDNPAGEAFWRDAGSTGAYPGCATSTSFYAPFQPNCGPSGSSGTVMALCGGQGFDSVERAWIAQSILPVLTCQNPPATNNPGDERENNNGTGGGGGDTGGGKDASCTCPNGWVIGSDGTVNQNYTGVCGEAVCGSDHQYWRCQTQNNWQPLGGSCGGTSEGGGAGGGYSITSGMADNLNYPGGDISGYDSPSPQMCQSDCQLNQECLAWTWVKPGYQGPSGKCWLKNGTHELCYYYTGGVSGAKPADVNNTCPIGPHGNGGPVPRAP